MPSTFNDWLAVPMVGLAVAIVLTVVGARLTTNSANGLLIVAWVIAIASIFVMPFVAKLEVIPRILWTALFASVTGLILYQLRWTEPVIDVVPTVHEKVEPMPSVKLAFEPQIEFHVLPETPDHELRFYDIRFVVRNAGRGTVNKFYYTFTFPYDCLIPMDQRLGRGDRDLFLDSKNRVFTTEGKKFYSMGGIFTNPIFEGRSINVGNLSLMEPLVDFNVRWDLSWEGGTKSGIMTFENGKLKIAGL